MIKTIVSLFLISVLISESFPQNKIVKTSGIPSRTYLNANYISTILENNGISDVTDNGNSGLIYPKGTGKTTMYESGFIWGAIVQSDSTIRVGGSMYSSGLQPGKILNYRIPSEQPPQKISIPPMLGSLE